jgi:hypothetical protein
MQLKSTLSQIAEAFSQQAYLLVLLLIFALAFIESKGKP